MIKINCAQKYLRSFNVSVLNIKKVRVNLNNTSNPIEINDLKKLIPFNKVNTFRYCCLSKTFRSEFNIKNRLTEIDNEIDNELTRHTYSSGHAFVTFNSLKSAYLCLQEFKESTYKKLKIKFDEIKNQNLKLFII